MNDFETAASAGKLHDRYDIYLNCSDDGTGRDLDTGDWLKTFEEWLGI